MILFLLIYTLGINYHFVSVLTLLPLLVTIYDESCEGADPKLNGPGGGLFRVRACRI